MCFNVLPSCMYVHHVHTWYPQRSGEGIIHDYGPPHGCWGLNPGPSQEQPVSTTAALFKLLSRSMQAFVTQHSCGEYRTTLSKPVYPLSHFISTQNFLIINFNFVSQNGNLASLHFFDEIQIAENIFTKAVC